MHRLLSWMIAPVRNAVMTSAKGYELYTALIELCHHLSASMDLIFISYYGTIGVFI